MRLAAWLLGAAGGTERILAECTAAIGAETAREAAGLWLCKLAEVALLRGRRAQVAERAGSGRADLLCLLHCGRSRPGWVPCEALRAFACAYAFAFACARAHACAYAGVSGKDFGQAAPG